MQQLQNIIETAFERRADHASQCRHRNPRSGK